MGTPCRKCVLTLGEVRTDPRARPYRPSRLGIQEKCLGSTGESVTQYRVILTEVRDLAMKLHGRYAGRPVLGLLKADWKKSGPDAVKGDALAQKLIVLIEG